MNRLYRSTFQAIHTLFRFRGISAFISRLSKIWLRHSQTCDIMRSFRIDGVIDGGAYQGEFASLVRVSIPEADLVCVEPQANCVRILQNDGYRVIEAALWYKEDTLTLSQPLPDGTSCTVVSADGTESLTPKVDVKATRLDSIPVRGNRLFIKLDLQGAEEQALEGMGELWKRCVMIQLEIGMEPHGNYTVLHKLLASHDFIEYATVNQFFTSDGRVQEADKIWLRRDVWTELFKTT
ncbi:MAG: FkbM family methyltransferase [Candidatus Methylacidiphilales bacterium]|nr:FkbM family methyltransferase [Candidatus Methylacidiphilales bacterium]